MVGLRTGSNVLLTLRVREPFSVLLTLRVRESTGGASGSRHAERDEYGNADVQSAEQTAMRDRLHEQLLAWMNRTRDPFRGYYWERRPWRTDARPATWHYTNLSRPTPVECGPKTVSYDTGLEDPPSA